MHQSFYPTSCNELQKKPIPWYGHVLKTLAKGHPCMVLRKQEDQFCHATPAAINKKKGGK